MSFLISLLNKGIICVHLLWNVAYSIHEETTIPTTTHASTFWNVTCRDNYDKCSDFTGNCARLILDSQFEQEDIITLHEIAEKGMNTRESVGGPTILDINTGFIRDSNGLDNLFTKEQSIFSERDFESYGNIIKHLKQLVSLSFGINEIYFTAPTFITKLDGRDSWEPAGNCRIHGY
jgi:hypothetical protein